MKVSVNWLQDFVKLAPPFEKVGDRLTLAGLEVKKIESLTNPKDTLFEVEVTTNRPDWLSHFGVAREIAAVQNLSLQIPEIESAKNRAMPHGWKIQLKELEACPYYTGVLVEGMTQQETPDFIKKRLEACGLRSISLIVDITNYVLLETGQPLHAFDADLIQGQEIRIRKAKSGEKMTTINDQAVELSSEDLIIADRDRAIAIAGVMGGLDSEVTSKTRNIFLESAFFHPRWVRKSSQRHLLSSESSYRFERRVDPEGVDFARERAIWLIKQYAKPRFISAVIKAGEKPKLSKTTIHLSDSMVKKVLGVEIKSHDIASILTRLGLNVSKSSMKGWNVRIPSFRSDLVSPVDLIEEIARIYGYENIPETLPERSPLVLHDNPILELENKIRQFLPGIGAYETVTFSLISEKGKKFFNDFADAVSIVNPQNKELSWMRPTLLTSLLDVQKRNFYAGAAEVQVFEIANVYRKAAKGKHPSEERTVGIALSGLRREKTWLDSARVVSFYDLKGILESFLSFLGIPDLMIKNESPPFFQSDISQAIFSKSEKIGYLGKVHPELIHIWDLEHPVFYAEFSLPKLLAHLKSQKTILELPRYPAIERDLSITVEDSVKAQDVEEAILPLGKNLIRQVIVFDLFQGGRIPAGHKNLGIRIVYQSFERTLVSDEIQQLHSHIAQSISQKFHATFQ